MRIAIAIFALFGTLSVHKSMASSTERFDEFTKKCGLSTDSNPRLFAAADGEHWKEYPSLDKIPEQNIDWSEGAFVLHSSEATATEIDGVSQDFSNSSLYCFDDHGKLAQIERDFATAWGWGYSETDLFKNGKVYSHQEHYFETKTRAVIPRPAGYDDVHDAMKLKVYKSIKELPFFKLM
ncbi:MAG TPA: hypothetical protein VN517_15155 [Terriglobales bacterium]|jgi:hypothetical protein|nr:hypothetical protein [Terriglobales bacterium]